MDRTVDMDPALVASSIWWERRTMNNFLKTTYFQPVKHLLTGINVLWFILEGKLIQLKSPNSPYTIYINSLLTQNKNLLTFWIWFLGYILTDPGKLQAKKIS